MLRARHAVLVLGLSLTGCSLHTNQEGMPAGQPGPAQETGASAGSMTTEVRPGAQGRQPGATPGTQDTTGPQPGGDCPVGQTRCAGRCVDLLSDVAHCGQCGDACASNHVQGSACVQGRCEGSCEAGFADCNSDFRGDGCEIDLRNDPLHCGACMSACAEQGVEAVTCEHGLCAGACKEGFDDCNGDRRSDGCEVNLLQDPLHCGACVDAACDPGAKCQAGSCVLDCAPDQVECSGACVVTSSDLSHCGACDQSCSSAGMQSQACVSGTCTGACAAGHADCNEALREDGCEIDVNSNPDHCGACSVQCSRQNVRTPLCSLGQCMPRCDVGFADCAREGNDGCETQVHSDVNNCGFCGFQCVQSGHMREDAVCEAGACKGECQLGFRDCNSDPSDGCEADLSSIENCGGCSVDCVKDLHLTAESATCVRKADSGPYGCQGLCEPKFGDCDGDMANGCEVDLRVDPAHCGACGQACAEGLVCDGEQCVSPS